MAETLAKALPRWKQVMAGAMRDMYFTEPATFDDILATLADL